MHSNIGENLSSRRTKKGRRVRGGMEICFMLMGAVHPNASGATQIGRGGGDSAGELVFTFSMESNSAYFHTYLPWPVQSTMFKSAHSML